MKKIIKFIFLMLLTCINSNTLSQGRTIFTCGGTEPFWDAVISETEVLFTLMGEDSVVFKYSEILKANGMQSGYIMIFKLENEIVKPSYLVLKKTEKCKCTDGMSDNEYEYEAYFIMDKITYFGCGIDKK